MTDCLSAEVRDSLPDLAHGRLGEVDAATFMAHVESCDACAAELALLRDVRASAPIAPRIDVASIVAAVPVRTNVVTPSHESARRTGFSVRPIFWKLAAAAAIVTAGTLVFNGGSRDSKPAASSVASRPSPATATATATPDVDAKAATDVAAGSIAAPENASLSLVTGVQDLTDEEIERLLAELDGIDGIPSADPQPVPLSLENLEVKG